MKIDEVDNNLGKTVHYRNDFRLLDHDFRFNAHIKRATANDGIVHEAELQHLENKGSLLIVPLEEVQVKTV